jgi:hypothetical protein
MINTSALNTPVVISRDSVLNFAHIVVRNLSVEVAVAIHNFGNQLIIFGNFLLQFESLVVVRCILIFFLSLFSFSSFQIFFPMLVAMALKAMAPSTLFSLTVRVFVFNGVHLIVSMVHCLFAAAGSSVCHWCRRSDASFSSFEINAKMGYQK